MKNVFNEMSVTPPPSIDSDTRYSQTVLVYEIEPTTKEVVDSDLGSYDFETKEWIVLGDFSMNLYCWCLIPNPTEFLQDKEWNFVTHKGYRK